MYLAKILQLFKQMKNGDGRLPGVSTSRAQVNMGGSAHSSTTSMFSGSLGTPGPVQQPSGSFGNFPYGTTGFGATNREVLGKE